MAVRPDEVGIHSFEHQSNSNLKIHSMRILITLGLKKNKMNTKNKTIEISLDICYNKTSSINLNFGR